MNWNWLRNAAFGYLRLVIAVAFGAQAFTFLFGADQEFRQLAREYHVATATCLFLGLVLYIMYRSMKDADR